MWLPDPIYERAPYYWMLLGMLFVAAGTYRTSDGGTLIGLVFLAAGVASCFWSVYVALNRKSRSKKIYEDLPLDETCELNYKPE